MTAQRELATHDHPETRRCTEGGVDHDFRPHHGVQFNRPHTFLRCVWCHGVTCGYFDQADPCMEIYHHPGDHRSRFGVVWPIGGTRPDVALDGTS